MTREFLVQKYVEAGLSSTAIARQLGCSSVHVLDRLRRWGIPIRSRSEARVRALEAGRVPGHRRASGDPSFFDAWSPAMAYVLGLLATDGCLIAPKVHARNGYHTAGYVSLTQASTELLEKVQRLTGSSGSIWARSTSGRTVHTMNVGGSRTYERLLELGLTARKSRTLSFPDVPSGLMRHFVRGCWDGDGSIYTDRRNGRLLASFVTASKGFAEGLVEALRAANLRVSRVYVEHRGADRDVYQIKVSRHEDTLALCRWMYDAVPEGQRLNRKYERYRKAAGIDARATGAAGGGGAADYSSRAKDGAEAGRAARGRPSVPKK